MLTQKQREMLIRTLESKGFADTDMVDIIHSVEFVLTDGFKKEKGII